MDELAPIAIALGVIIGVIYVLINGLRYLFMYASVALGHPLFLMVALTCAALLWQLLRIPDVSTPRATLFDREMSTRAWMIAGTATLLVTVVGYGALVL